MKIEIDDHIADDITIENLKKDLIVLSRQTDFVNEAYKENEDYIYSNGVKDAIKIVLGYYGVKKFNE